ncbi:MAG: YceI family protein [Acidobacteriota bacterium]
MKRFIPAALLLIASAVPATAADVYTVDKTHSEATFRVKHMFSKLAGKFTDFSGTISWDKADLSKSSVEFALKSASISTDNDKRDTHLKSDEFFGAEKCPEVTFKSTKIVSTAKDTFGVTGNLTMHCISKEITLPVKFLGEGKDPWGNVKAGFETTATLNRKDYNMIWNAKLDDGGFMLADDVEVTVSLETKKEAPAAK